ncbi:C2H2 transcription factor [Colletotrichum truncatum]|uniref:C2H2 transcription factor n=1 Tax=Colletotrichum truncatum TaxID=5467 RepID=A0ACC3Z749_COLTU|nr:C2H2 transcription factor [Colletotrichum truncatum]KAF6785248.1 C2H2 transcription factor [Colletotrichum truncatum]
MAAAFRPVNSPLPVEVKVDSRMITTPTTPRINTAPHPNASQPLPEDVKTPTKATFGGVGSSGNSGLASQKPLPSSPFPQAVQVPESAEKAKTPTRANSQHSRKSRDSEDVDMDESDGEGAGEDGAGSDDDSVNADGTRSNKKKKSQRFYCTDYPPCNLSFTRSEHLARHIRKHTGERPFQCHCSRRFSRLDNLRQHAQTVHVNEDIPIDSLAATGARFQRQMRTERVRQQGGRARASTAGSASGPVRGHSKSLSTSSIASVGSISSAFGIRDDIRRRPPPLVMADPRSRLSLESYRNDGPYGYRPASPTEYGTPTSATFSTGQSSPRWGSGVASPTTSHSRSQSMYSSGSRTPGRRLSVPSGANPFQSPHGGPVNRLVYGAPVNTSNNGTFSPAASSHLASPTTPTSGWSGRRDSTSSAADEAWRRRTWHPDTRNFNTNTSHLSNVLTPSQIQPNPAPPIANAPNPQQTLRLPGIESFDPLPSRQISPPRRIPSPMMVDSEAAHPPALLPSTDAAAVEDRRNVSQWDMGLHRGLTRLDITSNTTPPRDSAGAWANEANQAVQAQAEQVRLNPPTVRFEVDPPSYSHSSAFSRNHQHTMSAPSIASRDSKRHGWYHGPSASHVHGPRPEAPGHDPRGPHVNRMVHPNINAFPGFPARQAEPQPTQQQQPGRGPNPDPLRRLEALVAVATSEGTTATAY